MMYMWYSPLMKSLQAQCSFTCSQLLMLCTASASAKMAGSYLFSCFDQDMALSNNVYTLENKYEQEEQKCSFQPSWQSKRPWFSFVPEFSVSADSRNYGHDVLQCVYWKTGYVKFIKKVKSAFTWCSVAILPY